MKLSKKAILIAARESRVRGSFTITYARGASLPSSCREWFCSSEFSVPLVLVVAV